MKNKRNIPFFNYPALFKMQEKEIMDALHNVLSRGGGSHRKWFNPATGRGTTIPDWGQKDLKAGTITAVCRQLGINKNSL